MKPIINSYKSERGALHQPTSPGLADEDECIDYSHASAFEGLRLLLNKYVTGHRGEAKTSSMSGFAKLVIAFVWIYW